MKTKTKQALGRVLPLIGLVGLFLVFSGASAPQPVGEGASRKCVACHNRTTPVITAQWADSKHARLGIGCLECHAASFVKAFYYQFDETVEMYNSKFGKPAQEIVNALRSAGKITPDPFDDEIEWTFYHLWHHEGRRARMGVSMQGPDYTQWHGFFEVAHRFYFELIPQARELGGEEGPVADLIAEILARPEHKWRSGLSPEERRRIDEFYRQRYGQNH